MTTRYFEIRAPRADFTGRLGGISFADGLARVSFEGERDENGLSVRDEHGAQTGRAAVLFAQRRPGYTVTEVTAAGEPLPPRDAQPAKTPRTRAPKAPADDTKGGDAA